VECLEECYEGKILIHPVQLDEVIAALQAAKQALREAP
jgi:hypothetical protein